MLHMIFFKFLELFKILDMFLMTGRHFSKQPAGFHQISWHFMNVNHFGAEIQIFKKYLVDTMAADALAPCAISIHGIDCK